MKIRGDNIYSIKTKKRVENQQMPRYTLCGINLYIRPTSEKGNAKVDRNRVCKSDGGQFFLSRKYLLADSLDDQIYHNDSRIERIIEQLQALEITKINTLSSEVIDMSCTNYTFIRTPLTQEELNRIRKIIFIA